MNRALKSYRGKVGTAPGIQLTISTHGRSK